MELENRIEGKQSAQKNGEREKLLRKLKMERKLKKFLDESMAVHLFKNSDEAHFLIDLVEEFDFENLSSVLVQLLFILLERLKYWDSFRSKQTSRVHPQSQEANIDQNEMANRLCETESLKLHKALIGLLNEVRGSPRGESELVNNESGVSAERNSRFNQYADIAFDSYEDDIEHVVTFRERELEGLDFQNLASLSDRHHKKNITVPSRDASTMVEPPRDSLHFTIKDIKGLVDKSIQSNSKEMQSDINLFPIRGTPLQRSPRDDDKGNQIRFLETFGKIARRQEYNSKEEFELSRSEDESKSENRKDGIEIEDCEDDDNEKFTNSSQKSKPKVISWKDPESEELNQLYSRNPSPKLESQIKMKNTRSATKNNDKGKKVSSGNINRKSKKTVHDNELRINQSEANLQKVSSVSHLQSHRSKNSLIESAITDDPLKKGQDNNERKRPRTSDNYGSPGKRNKYSKNQIKDISNPIIGPSTPGFRNKTKDSSMSKVASQNLFQATRPVSSTKYFNLGYPTSSGTLTTTMLNKTRSYLINNSYKDNLKKRSFFNSHTRRTNPPSSSSSTNKVSHLDDEMKKKFKQRVNSSRKEIGLGVDKSSQEKRVKYRNEYNPLKTINKKTHTRGNSSRGSKNSLMPIESNTKPLYPLDDDTGKAKPAQRQINKIPSKREPLVIEGIQGNIEAMRRIYTNSNETEGLGDEQNELTKRSNLSEIDIPFSERNRSPLSKNTTRNQESRKFETKISPKELNILGEPSNKDGVKEQPKSEKKIKQVSPDIGIQKYNTVDGFHGSSSDKLDSANEEIFKLNDTSHEIGYSVAKGYKQKRSKKSSSSTNKFSSNDSKKLVSLLDDPSMSSKQLIPEINTDGEESEQKRVYYDENKSEDNDSNCITPLVHLKSHESDNESTSTLDLKAQQISTKISARRCDDEECAPSKSFLKKKKSSKVIQLGIKPEDHSSHKKFKKIVNSIQSKETYQPLKSSSSYAPRKRPRVSSAATSKRSKGSLAPDSAKQPPKNLLYKPQYHEIDTNRKTMNPLLPSSNNSSERKRRPVFNNYGGNNPNLSLSRLNKVFDGSHTDDKINFKESVVIAKVSGETSYLGYIPDGNISINSIRNWTKGTGRNPYGDINTYTDYANYLLVNKANKGGSRIDEALGESATKRINALLNNGDWERRHFPTKDQSIWNHKLFD